MRRLVMTLLLSVALADGLCCAQRDAHAQAMTLDRASGCRYLRPADLDAGATTWLGMCKDSRADGPGALRVTIPDEKPRFFFGTMLAGRPQRGVVTRDSDDVIAWRFDAAAAVAPKDREQTAAIYAAAAAGAGAVATRFKTSGNLASAKYYEEWRQVLATALDQGE